MTLAWYALHAKPQKEDFLWGELLARDIETFFPRIKVQRVNPRARPVRPYFPGYLFVRLEPGSAKFSSLQWLPGATGLVSFGGEPAFVPEGLIHAIQRKVEEIDAAGGEVLASLKPGDTVVIQDGPFKGYEAIFDTRISGNERVRVLLKMLRAQQFPLELPSALVQRKNRR